MDIRLTVVALAVAGYIGFEVGRAYAYAHVGELMDAIGADTGGGDFVDFQRQVAKDQ